MSNLFPLGGFTHAVTVSQFNLDNLDKDLTRLFKVDGRVPVTHIAKRL